MGRLLCGFRSDWPRAAAWIEAQGKPWPRELMLVDLVWMQEAASAGGPFVVGGREYRGRVPGRRVLQKRWSVSDRTARSLLAELG